MTGESALMARLTRILTRTPADAPLAQRLLVALSETLGVDGAAMTIGYATPDRATLSTTDEMALAIEELQDLLREGPGLDAFRTGLAVAVDRDAQGLRWPMLEQALSERHEAVDLFGVPMKPDKDVLGVVTLYRFVRREEESWDLDLGGAQFLVNAIGVAIVGRFDRPESTDLAWAARDRVNQAAGMVVVQLRIPPADALALLRAHAFAHGVNLTDVADQVVSRRLDFRTTDGERHNP